MNRKFFSQPILAISFVTAMGMVALEVSALMAIFSFAILVWKWVSENYRVKPLSRTVTNILSVLLLLQVLLQFRTLIGQEASYTFLLGLLALRIMDYTNDRDHKFVVLLGFLLISVKSLFTLDIYWVIPSALSFLGLWHSMLPPHVPNRTKILAKIFILSAPVAIILFFAFPRFVVPWALARGNTEGVIGFSDEMNPGQVSRLASTGQVAFRAKISELSLKKSEDLYWRGSVLDVSNGLSWKPARRNLLSAEREPGPLFYEIAMDPTSTTYLFVLDGTKTVQLDAGTVIPMNHDIFRSSRTLTKATVYRASWQQSAGREFKDKMPAEALLQIPVLTGKTAMWVEEIKSKNLTIQQRLDELEKFFSGGGFKYTLSPGEYRSGSMDEFLFDRKRGFCEHFAGAYATLARALGIHTQVVIGYQGGRYNSLGDFWKISQKDAHAWVEVLVDGVWQRRDPTSWVAPLRLIIGAEDFFDLSDADQQAFAKSIDWRPPANSQFLIFERMEFWFEAINYRWTYFLIDFDKNSQQSFWQSFFEIKMRALMIFMFALSAFIFIFRTFYIRKQTLTEEQLLIHAIEKWGLRKNLAREDHEPPLSYLKRLKNLKPDLAPLLGRIETFYDDRVYANKPSDSTARALLREWRKSDKMQSL